MIDDHICLAVGWRQPARAGVASEEPSHIHIPRPSRAGYPRNVSAAVEVREIWSGSCGSAAEEE